MLELKVNDGAAKRVLSLPTQLDEITPNYFWQVTRDVKIANHYALVALCVNDKLSVLCSTQQKDSTVRAVSVFVRANDPSHETDAVPVGTKIIAAPTDLMRGFEVTCPYNVLRPSFVNAMLSRDEEMMKNLFSYTDPVWLVTFKLVPLADIHGFYLPSQIDQNELNGEVARYVRSEQGEA